MSHSATIIPLSPPEKPASITTIIEAALSVPGVDLRREIFRQIHLLEEGDLEAELTPADLRRWITAYALIHKLVFGVGRVPEDGFLPLVRRTREHVLLRRP